METSTPSAHRSAMPLAMLVGLSPAALELLQHSFPNHIRWLICPQVGQAQSYLQIHQPDWLCIDGTQRAEAIGCLAQTAIARPWAGRFVLLPEQGEQQSFTAKDWQAWNQAAPHLVWQFPLEPQQIRRDFSMWLASRSRMQAAWSQDGSSQTSSQLEYFFPTRGVEQTLTVALVHPEQQAREILLKGFRNSWRIYAYKSFEEAYKHSGQQEQIDAMLMHAEACTERTRQLLQRRRVEPEHFPLVIVGYGGDEQQSPHEQSRMMQMDGWLFPPDTAAHLAIQLITLWRQAKRQRKAIQMERERSVTLLAAGIAHEILNPLGFVRQAMYALEQISQDVLHWAEQHRQPEVILPSHFASQLQDVYRSGKVGLDRIRQIVDDIRQFSKGTTAALVPTQLAEIFQRISDLMVPQRAALQWHCHTQRQVALRPGQLEQVLVNLIVNSWHAIEGQGRIVVEATDSEDGGICITVQDNGKGIPPKVQERLFEPFITSKSPGKGTGLGLSLSQRLIHEHGGHLRLLQTSPQGSTFEIWLPQASNVAESGESSMLGSR